MNARHGAVVLACAAWFGLAPSARASGNEWEQTSAADFAAGTLSSTTLIGVDGTLRLAASTEAWTQIDGLGTSDFIGLHMISNTAARAVGTLRTDANSSYNAARYDGSFWSEDATPTQGRPLNTVWMLSEGEGWAMGDPNGIIYYDQAWQDEVAYSTHTVRSIFLSNGADGWAVGRAGSILQFNGVEWNSVVSPVTDDLNGVSMVSPGEGWAVGASGRILRYDGASWSVAASPTDNALKSVSMLASGKGWAVGDSGTIIRYNGTEWKSQVSPTLSDNLASVWMVSEDEGWAVGDSGVILRYDGAAWSLANSPVVDSLLAVSFGSPERGLAMGQSGTALKYARDYFAAGTFVSSVFEGGGSPAWNNLSWDAAGTAPGVEVKFQVASGASSPPADFRGPDGTAGTYYTTSGQALWAGHNPDRYIRYKAYFSTDNPVLTPQLKSVTISY